MQRVVQRSIGEDYRRWLVDVDNQELSDAINYCQPRPIGKARDFCQSEVTCIFRAA